MLDQQILIGGMLIYKNILLPQPPARHALPMHWEARALQGL